MVLARFENCVEGFQGWWGSWEGWAVGGAEAVEDEGEVAAPEVGLKVAVEFVGRAEQGEDRGDVLRGGVGADDTGLLGAGEEFVDGR